MADPTWSGRTSYSGKAVNWGLYYIFIAAVKMLATPYFGGETDGKIKLYQGSWSGAATSAGTHTKTSAADTTPFNYRNRVLVFRILGCAAWFRAKSNAWTAHIHLIVCGDSGAHWLALRQVVDFWRGRNGLKGSGPDNGPKMYGAKPLFIFPLKEAGRPRTVEVIEECHAYTRQSITAPTYGAKIPAGTKLKIVAFTRDADTRNRWGVTAEGKCVMDTHFKDAA